MRIRPEDLAKFGREVSPPPPPVEPVLPPDEEARLIARGSDTDPTVRARRARVLTLIRRPATPHGADAELLALLAAAGKLPVERREDWVAARQRLAGIGALSDPPPAIRDLRDRLRVTAGDGAAFADALLRRSRDFNKFHESFATGGGDGTFP